MTASLFPGAILPEASCADAVPGQFNRSGSGLPGSRLFTAATAVSAQAPSRRRVSRDGFSAAELGTGAPLAFAAVLLLLALLAAPEQPRHQEAICQRHNGAEACRVW